MNDRYLTIGKSDWTKLTIKKSKFFSRAFCVNFRHDVKDLEEEIIKDHSSANHVVYAYRLRENSKIINYNTDAGEPARSSGPPILKVIKGIGLLNAGVFVVRYFGGTKLGIGGLIKAYTKSAQLAIENASIIKKINFEAIKLRTDYENLGTILGKIEQHNGNIENIEYGKNIEIEFKITKSNLDKLKKDEEINLD